MNDVIVTIAFCCFQSLQEEIVVHSNTYNTLRQLAEELLQTNSEYNLQQLQTQLNEINQRWNNLEVRYDLWLINPLVSVSTDSIYL